MDTTDCEPQPQVTIKGNHIKKSETAKNTYIFETSTKWSADELDIVLDTSTEAGDWLVDGKSYTKHNNYNGRSIKYGKGLNYLSIAPNNKQLTVKVMQKFDPSSFDISTITIKPLLVGHDYTAKATATSELAEDGTPKGTVSVKATKSYNTYQLTATANDGYSFDHWSKADHSEWLSTENPLTTEALTADTAYIACFHRWTQPSIVCVDENGTEITGLNGSATRVKDDTWQLTAGGADGWKFAYWSKGDSTEQYSENSMLSESVTTQITYYAHYKPVYITGIASVKAYTNGSGSLDQVVENGTGLAAGANVTVDVAFTSNSDNVAESHAAVYQGGLETVKKAVEAGTAAPMAVCTFKGWTEHNTVKLAVERWPADIEKITAVAYTEGGTKYFKELDVKTRTAESLGLTYLSTPVNSSLGGVVSAPRLYSTQAYIDTANGGIKLYAAGVGGVYQLETNGATDMVQMQGMEDLKTSGAGFNDLGAALAIGRADNHSNDLVALVFSATDMQINGQDTSNHYELRY